MSCWIYLITVSQKWEWVHSLFPVSSIRPAGVVTCGKGQDWNACLFGDLRNVPVGPSVELYVRPQAAESVGSTTVLAVPSESGHITP